MFFSCGVHNTYKVNTLDLKILLVQYLTQLKTAQRMGGGVAIDLIGL